MIAFRNLVSLGIILVLIVTANVSSATSTANAKVKGIILLIGDGMGLNQVRAADIYSKQLLGKSLVINSIVTRGVTTTYSANSEVTDSSAAATAIYSGYKVNNGSINILPDGRKVSTIAKAAKMAGLSVGIVSTTRLTHATPAAIYSHSIHRDDENFIAEQLLAFDPDVAMGGGLQHFIPQEQKGSKRTDDKNLIDVLKTKGYTYVTSADQFKKIDPATTPKLIGLFAMSHMAYELDRQNTLEFANQPTLADMTKAAFLVLEKNPKGFFIMIEGGRIDHACHAHDITAVIYDTIAFDEAVRAALEYQKKNPDVLVLVTGDHETGGLGLGRGTEYALDLAALKPIKNSLEYLTKKMKQQPAEFNELIKAAGFELTGKENALLFKYNMESKADAVPELSGYSKIDNYVFSWIHYALSSIESERAKIGWTSFAHTAQPVITYAVGPGENEFLGFYDNTDIAKKMARLLGLTLDKP